MNNPLTNIDEQVAEHVMGFAVWPCCVHGELPANCRDHRFDANPNFRPTTNLLHAWQIVDYMMQKRGYEFRAGAWHEESISNIINYASFEVDRKIHGGAHSPTMPLAICEAALKAVLNAR